MLYKIFYTGLMALIENEIRRFVRVWSQTILPPVITSALYFIIFGNLIGKKINITQQYSFIEYLAPGLIMMAMITNAYANTSSSFFLAKFQRSIEELLISPLPNSLIILGFVTGGIVRGLVVCIAVTITASFFAHLSAYHVILLITAAIFSSALFAILGLINGIYAKTFDHIAFIPTFVLTPLTYLGGVFYSVSILPPFWHHLSMANPILYMVNMFRYSMLGITDVNIQFALIFVIALVITLYCLALWLLNKGVGIKT